jgi:hypothetical protein
MKAKKRVNGKSGGFLEQNFKSIIILLSVLLIISICLNFLFYQQWQKEKQMCSIMDSLTDLSTNIVNIIGKTSVNGSSVGIGDIIYNMANSTDSQKLLLTLLQNK